MIDLAYLWAGEILCIIADSQHQLVCHQSLGYQVECHAFCHLLYHHTGFLEIVGLLQHLSATEGVRLWSVGLHRLHRAGLPAPGMVYEQLCIHTEKTIEQFFILYGHSRQLAHRVNAIDGQFLCNAVTHSPELGNRTIVP